MLPYLRSIFKLKSSDGAAEYESLASTLMSLVRTSLTAHSKCFLLPSTWTSFERLIQSCLDQTRDDHRALFMGVKLRNQRFLSAPTKKPHQQQRSVQRELFRILDHVGSNIDIHDVSEKCFRLSRDPAVLGRAIIIWATVPDQSGPARLHLALRLIRIWRQYGVDLDAIILKLLWGPPTRIAEQPSSLCKLVGELIRSQDFSVASYLQRLMASGIPTQARKAGCPMKLPECVLIEMPLEGLSTNLLNLRHMLLREYTTETTDVSEEVEAIKSTLATEMRLFSGESQLVHQVDLKLRLPRHCGSVKFELARWLRQSLSSSLLNNSTSRIDGQEDRHVSHDDLSIIIQLLEDLRRLLIPCQGIGDVRCAVRRLDSHWCRRNNHQPESASPGRNWCCERLVPESRFSIRGNNGPLFT